MERPGVFAGAELWQNWVNVVQPTMYWVTNSCTMWPWVHKISHRDSVPISVFPHLPSILAPAPLLQILPCSWASAFIPCFWFYSHSLYLKKNEPWLLFSFVSLNKFENLEIRPCKTQIKPRGPGPGTQTGLTLSPGKEEPINSRTLGSFQRWSLLLLPYSKILE